MILPEYFLMVFCVWFLKIINKPIFCYLYKEKPSSNLSLSLNEHTKKFLINIRMEFLGIMYKNVF